MSADLIETLPLAQRLALSYAPRDARPATLAFLALDTRLAGIIRADGEPVIAQMKLAWWRDRLAQAPQEWPLGEPLLALLRESGLDCAKLSPLVDGWEVLLSDQLGSDAIAEFADGRARGWSAVASATAGQAGDNVEAAARRWAMVDLALNLGTDEEATAVRHAARAESWKPLTLSRPLRSLAVLHGLARRAILRDTDEMLDGPGAMGAALRLGILGK